MPMGWKTKNRGKLISRHADFLHLISACLKIFPDTPLQVVWAHARIGRGGTG